MRRSEQEQEARGQHADLTARFISPSKQEGVDIGDLDDDIHAFSDGQSTISTTRSSIRPDNDGAAKCFRTSDNAAECNNACFGVDLLRGNFIEEVSYGEIFARSYCAMVKSTGRLITVKCIQMELENDPGRDIRSELERLESLQHRNIQQVLGHFCCAGRVNVHVERCDNSVKTFLEDFGPMPGSCLALAARCCLEGLGFLHTLALPIAHGGIRGANVFMCGNGCYKLGDMGTQFFGGDCTHFLSLGGLAWQAPEVFQKPVANSLSADIWSLGCMVIEMATAACPWGDLSLEALILALSDSRTSHGPTPRLPWNLSKEMRCFARRCLQRDPAARAGITELLAHQL